MNCLKMKTGDVMHVSECKENDVTYGLISIQLKNAIPVLNVAEKILNNFMQQLQPVFDIQHTTGIIYESTQTTQTSIVDYWQDIDKLDWKVKGWTDGNTLAVLYIKNIGGIAVGKEELFLNGAIFNQG